MKIKLLILTMLSMILLLGLSAKLSQATNKKMSLDLSKFLKAPKKKITVKILSVQIVRNHATTQSEIDDERNTLSTFVLSTECPHSTNRLAEEIAKYEFEMTDNKVIDLRYKFEFFDDDQSILTFYADKWGRIQFKGEEIIYRQVGKGKSWLLEFWEIVKEKLYDEELLKE